MTIHWKAVQQYFTVVLFGLQIYPVVNLGKFINSGFGTIRGKRLNGVLDDSTMMHGCIQLVLFILTCWLCTVGVNRTGFGPNGVVVCS